MAPFIYIAALRRTGSTVLSESLTSFPSSFIFREPKLGRKRFTVKSNDAELFLKHGIDLKEFSEKWSGNSLMDRITGRNRMMRAFQYDLMPRLLAILGQVGVKEIHHIGWPFYADAFPEMKVVLTARDPRDIFISTYYRVREGKDHFRRGFSARELARDLNRDFRQQQLMSQALPSMKITYEDFCSDTALLDKVKTFVGSRIDGTGGAGQFNIANPNRVAEARVHGDKVTSTRVDRWRQETDANLVREAHKVFDRMPEYVEFWGYER